MNSSSRAHPPSQGELPRTPLLLFRAQKKQVLLPVALILIVFFAWLIRCHQCLFAAPLHPIITRKGAAAG